MSSRCGAEVVLKAENLQRTGSFKLRGALNKLAILGPSAAAGIVVASAGNHAQAAAYAAKVAGIGCEVFMPADASIGKAEAAAGYGATVHLGGSSVEEALELARASAERDGKVLVHPFEDPDVIAGQGTLGLELLEDVDELSCVVVPVGGGGLSSGIAIALKASRPQVTIIGVQAAACAPYLAARHLAATSPAPERRRVTKASRRHAAGTPVVTLADGIAVKSPGVLTTSILSRLVDDVVSVNEDEIAEAMVLLLERSKLVVEGAGAVGVAALISGAIVPPRSGMTVAVCSGGNVDLGLLAPVIRRHETIAGRRMVCFARVSDRPGQLARLLECLGSAGANLVAVEHLREGVDLHVRETAVHLTLETRNREHARCVLEAATLAGFDIHPVGPTAEVLEPT